MNKIVSKSLKDTEEFAKTFLSQIEKNRPRGDALTVALYGDLGSGKTAFVKSAAKILGVPETVSSPTFVIEKIYKLSDDESGKPFFKHLIHIDAYRLSSGKELVDLGWEEIIKNPKNLIFMEWPENVKEILPKELKKIYFKFINGNTREIRY